jgi:hypothetical protein
MVSGRVVSTSQTETFECLSDARLKQVTVNAIKTDDDDISRVAATVDLFDSGGADCGAAGDGADSPSLRALIDICHATQLGMQLCYICLQSP